jgi:hypothetical protein
VEFIKELIDRLRNKSPKFFVLLQNVFLTVGGLLTILVTIDSYNIIELPLALKSILGWKEVIFSFISYFIAKLPIEDGSKVKDIP